MTTTLTGLYKEVKCELAAYANAAQARRIKILIPTYAAASALARFPITLTLRQVGTSVRVGLAYAGAGKPTLVSMLIGPRGGVVA